VWAMGRVQFSTVSSESDAPPRTLAAVARLARRAARCEDALAPPGDAGASQRLRVAVGLVAAAVRAKVRTEKDVDEGTGQGQGQGVGAALVPVAWFRIPARD
jgi:hypothetical protein